MNPTALCFPYHGGYHEEDEVKYHSEKNKRGGALRE